MTRPFLEQIAVGMNYGELPETWRVPDIERFFPAKTLYDYQTDALRNAARVTFTNGRAQKTTRKTDINRENAILSIAGSDCYVVEITMVLLYSFCRWQA